MVAYVAADPDKWTLATNLTSGYRAVGWIASSSPSDFRLITTSGEVVRWPQHGLGADGTWLWLGADGGYATSEPTGSAVVNVQEVGRVLDPSTLIVWFPKEKEVRAGAATLVAGAVTVGNTSVTTGTLIFLTRSVTGGTLGHLSYTISAGTSFTINSSSATDTSTVNWLLIEPA